MFDFGREGFAECELARGGNAQLDAHLDGREWLVGDGRSGADLFLFMLTRWARHLDPKGWDRPALGAFYDRTAQLPGVQRMLAEMEIEARP